jgi:glycosyltransferase involved in cell wall biosynthesis
MSRPEAETPAKRQAVLLLGPRLEALSGVSTHLKLLLRSRLADDFTLLHFQVGSEGRNEDRVARWMRLLVSPFRFAAAVVASRAAIVHINTALNARAYWRDLAYMVVARLCGARVLYQVHGGALPQAFLGTSRVLAAFLRATLQLPDAIVVLARAELAAFREFVPRQQVLALPNAVDCAPYARLTRSHAGAETPLRLLYIGRLAREKGLHETLQGLKLALAQGIKAELIVAGSGPEEAQLKRSAEQFSLGRDVVFVGPVSGEGRYALLRWADASILASYAEGLPYALLESMAAGVPPIASRVGAIPDIVVDGRHGVLIAPADPQAIAQAIRVLASDRGLLARMREACRGRIANGYAIDRLARDFCRLYAEICGAKKGVDAAPT